MEKAKKIISLASALLLLLLSGSIKGNIDYSGGSFSCQTSSQTTQTKTGSVQTVTKPVQTTKSAQTGTKSVQSTAKTTQQGTKSGQTTTKTTQQATKSVQTTTKTTQTGTKSVQTKPKTSATGTKSVPAKTKTTPTAGKPTPKSTKPEPAAKAKDPGAITIGSQTWAVANLNVSTFRNGDTIPEARTNKEWEAAGTAGKPAWCYYNNNPAIGLKYGKLYNWYAVNDPRELAPEGWMLSSDEDWANLTYFLGGQEVAGKRLKSTEGWSDGYYGTNDAGFNGLPGGYRVENGTFLNINSIGTWWSTTESKATSAIDHYISMGGSLGRSISPKQRGQAVRCIRK